MEGKVPLVMDTLIRKGHFRHDLLHHRRYELGLTLEQLAARVGRAFSTIHTWETGLREPTPRLLARLSRALRVAPTYFYQQASQLNESKATPLVQPQSTAKRAIRRNSEIT